MRLRAFVIGLVAMVSIAVAAPAAQAARAKPVKGTFDGAGGLLFQSSCPLAVYASNGTYAAKNIGRGSSSSTPSPPFT